MKTHLFLLVLSLGYIFLSCSDDEPCASCNPPIVTAFHAQWVNADTLELFYRIQYEKGTGVAHVSIPDVRIFEGPSAVGPWSQVASFTGWAGDAFRIPSRFGDAMHFYRMELDMEEGGRKLTTPGPMIAAIRPFVDPESLEPKFGIIDATKWSYLSGTSTTCLSPDGNQLFTTSGGGMTFDFSSGYCKAGYGGEEDGRFVEWRDSTITVYSNRGFAQWKMPGRTRSHYYNGTIGFSYRKDDTSVAIQKWVGLPYFYSYNLVTGKVTDYEWNADLKHPFRRVTRSPSGKYFTAYSEIFATAMKKEATGILDEQFRPVRTLDLFGNYVPLSNTNRNVQWTRDADNSVVQWDATDDRLYFWAHFSGRMELWTYSISKNQYAQITGYTPDQYPGAYANTPFDITPTSPAKDRDFVYTVPSSLNPVYNPYTDKLLLFFVYRNRYILIREAPPEP